MEAYWTAILVTDAQMGNVEGVEKALRKGGRVDGVEGSMKTPLHFAADRGNLPLASLLCRHLADLDLPSKQDEGGTALHLSSRAGHVDVTKLLLEEGAKADTADDNGKTPLYYAVQAGCGPVVDILLAYNPSLDLRDRIGRTPLHLAAERGSSEIVSRLLGLNIEVDAQDELGARPLHLGAFSGSQEVVRQLLEAGATRDAQDLQGMWASHYAAAPGHSKVLEELRSWGSPLDPQSWDSTTPLHLAAEHNRLVTVRWLVSQGVSVICEDASGDTPEARARKKGFNSVANYLRRCREREEEKKEEEEEEDDDDEPVHLEVPVADARHAPAVDNSSGADFGNAERQARETVPPEEHAALAPLGLLSNTHSEDPPSIASSEVSITNIPPRETEEVDSEESVTDDSLEESWVITESSEETASPIQPETVAAQEDPRRPASSVESRRVISIGTQEELEPWCSAGREDQQAQAVLDAGAEPSPRRASGWNQPGRDPTRQLLAAASEGVAEVVEELVGEGADVEACSTAPGEEGLRPLHLACWGGYTALVKQLLRHGASPHATAQGRQAVHWAAYGGHVEVLQVVARSEAALNCEATEDGGSTPLHLAAENGNDEATCWLVERGANVLTPNANGVRASNLAKEAGHRRVFRFLHQREKAEQLINIITKGNYEAVRQLLESGADANTVSYRRTTLGWRPLHLAADEGHTEVVQLLLTAEAKVDAKTPKGETAVHLAVQAGHLRIVQLLLPRLEGVDLSVNGLSLVHLAALGGHLPVLVYLKSVRHDLHALTIGMKTTLHLAADNGNYEATKWLVREGVNFNTKDGMGLRAEDYAKRERHRPIVAFLQQAAEGQRAKFLEAVRAGQGREVEAALAAGVDVNCKSDDPLDNGGRAVHLAASRGHEVVLTILRNAGADLEALDDEGKNALQKAMQWGHTHLLGLSPLTS